jgi:hypothetical protein
MTDLQEQRVCKTPVQDLLAVIPTDICLVYSTDYGRVLHNCPIGILSQEAAATIKDLLEQVTEKDAEIARLKGPANGWDIVNNIADKTWCKHEIFIMVDSELRKDGCSSKPIHIISFVDALIDRLSEHSSPEKAQGVKCDCARQRGVGVICNKPFKAVGSFEDYCRNDVGNGCCGHSRECHKEPANGQ